MQTRTVARIGALAFVVFAIAVSAIEAREQHAPGREGAVGQRSVAAVDPLRGELIRCQAIGQAGAADGDCLRAWAENRRRFLAPDARPGERPDAGVARAMMTDEAGNAAVPASGAR